jgi:CHAT domain-containing protein
VHLATHAVADAENPMYSYLMLSRGGAAGDDGRLEAWEIANLNLRAELVVLSACETARGQYLDGEGIIGLSWAWFLAGTPAAVLSRWKVDSAATAELMVAFHENRGRDGVGDAEALRQAAIAMMRDKRYRHPFYWASFQVIGAARR